MNATEETVEREPLPPHVLIRLRTKKTVVVLAGWMLVMEVIKKHGGHGGSWVEFPGITGAVAVHTANIDAIEDHHGFPS